jgi:poly(beta-D-mannuronate) lyase
MVGNRSCAIFLLILHVGHCWFTCDPTPPPIFDIVGISYYADRADSVVVAERYEHWQNLSQPINDFVVRVASMARVNASTDEHTCALNWLRDWARQGALLGNVSNGQAEMLRQWSISGLSLAYHRLCRLRSEHDAVIEQWFVRTVLPAINEWNKHIRWQKRNNHLYWSGLSAMSVGLAANDPSLIAYGRAIYVEGIGAITDIGVLPLERRRGRRILHYHCYALQPLMMTAELSRSLGEDWYRLRNGRIGRLVQLSVRGLRDVAVFQSIARQTDIEQPRGAQLGWLYLVARSGVAPNVLPLDDVIDKTGLSKTAFVPRLGGDLSDFASARFQLGRCAVAVLQ